MSKYDIPEKTMAQIADTYGECHEQEGQLERYGEIRQKARELAELIASETPPGRAQATALTHVENALLWANQAIAHE